MRNCAWTALTLALCIGTARAADSAWSLLEAGRKHLAAQEKDKAAKCFEAAVKRDARCADAWYQLGRLAEDRADTPKARECYAQVSSDFPVFAAAQERLGCLALSAGDRPAALEYFRAAAEARPGLEAWIQVATVQLDLRQYEGAGESLDSAAKFATGDAKVDALRARLAFETSRFEDAEKLFAELWRRFPRDTSSGFMLGLARLKLDRDDEAAETFVAVLERDPYHKASIQALLGMWEGDESRAKTVAELKTRLQAIKNSPNRVRKG